MVETDTYLEAVARCLVSRGLHQGAKSGRRCRCGGCRHTIPRSARRAGVEPRRLVAALPRRAAGRRAGPPDRGAAGAGRLCGSAPALVGLTRPGRGGRTVGCDPATIRENASTRRAALWHADAVSAPVLLTVSITATFTAPRR